MLASTRLGTVKGDATKCQPPAGRDSSVDRTRTEHRDCCRFNVTHLKKEFLEVSFTNETNSHTLKRKCGTESIEKQRKTLEITYITYVIS